MARRVYNFLANGAGGIDWGGIDLACEKFGVDLDDDLLDRLLTIKRWRPPEDGDNANDETEDKPADDTAASL